MSQTVGTEQIFIIFAPEIGVDLRLEQLIRAHRLGYHVRSGQLLGIGHAAFHQFILNGVIYS